LQRQCARDLRCTASFTLQRVAVCSQWQVAWSEASFWCEQRDPACSEVSTPTAPSLRASVGVSVAERQQEVNSRQRSRPCRIVVKHRHIHARPGWQLQSRFWTPRRRPRMRRGGGRVEVSSEPASVQSESRPPTHEQRPTRDDGSSSQQPAASSAQPAIHRRRIAEIVTGPTPCSQES
jgi:hypothetical protein